MSKLDRLPLEWIRVFEAAGRSGSFTAAANEIGLTQAAVSQRIKHLEQSLGVSLFSRQARGVTLTVDGEAWLPHVTRALQGLNRSAEELFGKAPRRIVISASASVSQMWIIPRLARAPQRPDTQIALTTMTIEPDFAKANAAIEIRYIRGSMAVGRSARIYREALAPMAAPSLLKSGADWRKLPRIAVSGPRPGWQEWALFTGDTAPSAPAFRFDNYVLAHAAARTGLGVLLGSLPLAANDLANDGLVRLSGANLSPDCGYWMRSEPQALSDARWAGLVDLLCEQPDSP
jgi:LysR family glycine cleavage system transcriptional activator